MMKMITKTKGLNFFSQLTKQVGLCCGLFLFLSASAFAQTCYTLNVTGGSYASEVSWNLLSDGNIVSSGVPTADEELCLVDGCYTVEMIDSYGDGWNGAEWSLSLDGELAIGPYSFDDGSSATADFAVGDVVCAILGCNDEEALNFDPMATQDDGSCQYPVSIDCEQAYVGEHCYDSNDTSFWIFEVEAGNLLNLNFIEGTIESCCDDIYIYDGATTDAPLLYQGTVPGGDITQINVNSTGNALRLELDTDGSISCSSGSYTNWVWEVSCGASYDCPELELNIGQACDDLMATTYDDIVSENCECIGTPFDCEELLMDFGTPCDDENEATTLDVITEDCECVGQVPPANDECEDAFFLVCGVTTNGSTALASPAPEGLPFCTASSTIAPGVWYTYFAMDNNPTIIDLAGSAFDTKLFVYTGLCGELECIAGNDDFNGAQSQVSFESVAGTYYYVFVTGFGSNSGDYSISINCGYDCDLINEGSYFGDACDDENSGTYGDVVTENCECVGTPFDCQELEANIGDACENAEGFENSVITENCECIGTEIPPAPENNEACNATEVFCGDLVYGNNVDATNTASKCNGSLGGNDVWYVITPAEAMTITLETCLEGTTFDTDLSVFTGACDALECNPGFGGAGHIDGDSGCSFASWASSGSFDAQAGVTYTIQLTGYGSSNSGDFALSISCEVGVDCPDLGLNIGAPCDDGDENTTGDTVNADCGCVGIPVPENDLCENAIEINCGDLVTGNNSAASNTHNKCNGSTGGKDVWYSFTSDVNATVYLETCLEGTTFDTDMSVFTGACDALECELSFGGSGHIDGNSSCSFASWASGGEFVAVAGVEYTIQLTGFSSSNEGDFALSVSCVEIFDCPELEANVGGACDDGDASTENDIADENCGCAGTPIETTGCEDYVMYMNDNEGGESDIYAVDISSGNAELTYITTVDFHAHIAYNPENNLIYVMHNGNGSYVTVNPHVAVPVVSAPVFLSEDVPGITAAAFSPNGNLLVGSATQNIIYNIDINGNTVTTFDSYAPVSGGDIVVDATGMLYMATRSGNGLYELWPDEVMDDQLIGNISNLVTGMALTASNQFLLSHNGNANLHLSNLDGSDAGVTFPLMLDGEAFMQHNGDMAAGCNTYNQPNEGDCDAFSTFYSHQSSDVSGSDIYRVTYSGANANMEFLTNVSFGTHIAYDGGNDIIYMVNPNGSFVRAYDPTAGIFLGDLPIVGNINSLYAVVFNNVDGMLYVGDANSDKVHSIDLITGVSTLVAEAPVNGGDLSIQDGKLYLADRTNADLYEIVGGVAVLVGDMPAANGMAQANNATGLILASPGSSDFIEINAADGSVAQSYTAMVEGNPLTLDDGDMAAGCSDDEPIVIIYGECYATEIVEYMEGTAQGGGAIPANRADANNALGAPERVDQLVFVALGYGGSLTVAFDGAVPNGEGDDIEVVETSYNNAGCADYPEYADVSVSMDGITWFSAGTVCKGDAFVDISDAGDFEYVNFVRISNIDDTTTSPDAFDVDGVVALHNCEDDGVNIQQNEDVVIEAASNNTLSSYPNPTAGASQVVFVTAETANTLVEVYDMNGRVVETLFNQVAQQGQEYRIDFNGTALPNGIYVYKMTTNNETIVNKFMIAR